MPEEIRKPLQNEGPVRVLNTRAVMAHYRHLKERPGVNKKCQFCASGVGAVISEVEVEKSKSVVHESDGIDKSGDASQSHDSRWPWGPDSDVHKGKKEDKV